MDKTLKDFFASLKCLVGIHHIPEKLAFPRGSIFIAGGICPRCGRLKSGRVIGDIRDYRGPRARREGSFLILPNGYCVFTSVATMKNLHDFYPEEYRNYLAKVEFYADSRRK